MRETEIGVQLWCKTNKKSWNFEIWATKKERNNHN